MYMLFTNIYIYIYIAIYFQILPFDNEQCNYKIETIIIIF